MRKAVSAIDKRVGRRPRKPMFLGLDMVTRLVQPVRETETPVDNALAMCFLACYIFMLRMPSECLPMVVAAGTDADAKTKAVVTVEKDCVKLRLLRRKNREHESVIKRTCWCANSSAHASTCPVHVLGKYLAGLGPGCQPFAVFDKRSVLQKLRGKLQSMRVHEATMYRTHDFRRGHARDLQIGGKTLYHILKAGDWKSPAFLAYMDKAELEHGAVAESHLQECIDESTDDDA